MDSAITTAKTSLAEQWVTQLAERGDRGDSDPAWLRELRRAGAAAFEKYGLPHRKVEDWKYTSLKMLEARSHRLVDEAARGAGDSGGDWPAPLIEAGIPTIRLLNGRPAGEINVDGPVKILSMNQALAESGEDSWLEDMLGRLELDAPARAFSALNTSMLGHGLVIDVPADTEGGTLLLQWAFDQAPPAMLFNTRVVIRLQAGARLTLIEQFESAADHAHGLNLVTQVDVGPNAHFSQVHVQQESDEAALIARTEATVREGGAFESHAFDWGGGLVRHDTRPRLLEANACADVNGAFVLRDEQHLDHHLYVDHAAGETRSGQFFRGVLGGKSRGVFNGKARIQQGADGSSVRQSNANLLLSRMAEIDTKPELEIYADEVEAAHGATVGQLDEDAVFYMRARGLSEEQARGMLTSAFCKAVLERMTTGSTSLGDEIAERMEIALSEVVGSRIGPAALPG